MLLKKSEKARFNNISLKIYLLLLIFLASCLSGCALLAGTVDSVRRAGLTEGSRESLLSPAATKFNEAVGWGDLSLAISMATDAYRTELRDQLVRDKDKIKIIDSSVDLSEFQNSAYSATIYMTVRAYTIPYYVAEPKKQIQHWEFSLSNGWKISKIEALSNK